jgi:hypothetical protein
MFGLAGWFFTTKRPPYGGLREGHQDNALVATIGFQGIVALVSLVKPAYGGRLVVQFLPPVPKRSVASAPCSRTAGD